MLRASRVSASLRVLTSRWLRAPGALLQRHDLHIISWAEQLWARWIQGWGEEATQTC